MTVRHTSHRHFRSRSPQSSCIGTAFSPLSRNARVLTPPASRSAANFGIWALTAAQKKEQRLSHRLSHHHIGSIGSTISASDTASLPVPHPSHAPLLAPDADAANAHEHALDSDSESETSSISDSEDDGAPPETIVRVTGREPSFVGHMVRERVTPAGRIRAMEPASEIPGCNQPREEIGVLHVGPVRKWQAKRAEWDVKYAKDLTKWSGVREADHIEAEEKGGFLGGRIKGGEGGERPPRCALARWWSETRALEAGDSVDATGKHVNMALALWSKVSAVPDEEVAGDKQVEEVKAKVAEEGSQA